MSAYIHYSKTACSMNDVSSSIIVDGFDADTFQQKLMSANAAIHSPQQIQPRHRPLVLPSSRGGPSVCAPVCTPAEHEVLASTAHAVGGAATMALADLVVGDKISDYVSDMNTFGGNGIGASAAVSNIAINAIRKYDIALAEYEKYRNHRAAPRTIKAKQLAAKRAYDNMAKVLKQRGMHLLHKNSFRTKEVKNLNGRVVQESIPVQNSADVQKLAKFAKVAKVAGPGFVLLDGYLRYDSVQTKYQANDPTWKRAAFVQAGGFAAGVAAGAIIGFAIAVTPVGLVVGAIAAGFAALFFDDVAQQGLGWIYDTWIN